MPGISVPGMETPQEHRNRLLLDGRSLSYIDFGPADGKPLLALHGHFSEGLSFAGLAAELAPEWRVIAPDQGGHGESDRTPDHSREAYVADALALLDHLGLASAVVLGHSMGGKNAYHLAARHPERVRALINVDDPVVITDTGPSGISFCLDWPRQAPTREALLDGLGAAAPMVAPWLRRQDDGGWRLPFVPEDVVASDLGVRGDHWPVWLASDCPALLVHGRTSFLVTPGLAREMAERRPHTRRVELDAGHFIPTEDPEGLVRAVREFLGTLG
ncbi:alpha/beta hydrolase [Streptomyces chrestomyceticus JCM 4735]|uniref:Alpha/beta hydrolase n=2 Tax=Streptomyces chrestomyceticus TaxID=68185 RepID=A0A7U9KZP8_9ACTN|nr:alpha/beta hydrolase [Streptomyces chrestomyceticus JCM 4735]